ncbi:MAG: cupin domain-containing protein [Acidobacteriota bacterium]
MIAVSSVLWVANGQRQTKGATAKPKFGNNFTGGEVTPVEDKYSVATAHYKFGPGARTKWHSHSGGQVMLTEEGVCHHQNKGGPVRELRAGETYYVPPGVMHWHGSAPGESAVQFNTTRGEITWADPVTDAEYQAKAKR